MTLFGRAFDAQEIAGLVGLLAALVFWIFVLRRERSWERWFRGWEAGRKARREAGLSAGHKGGRRGPWG